MSVGSVLVLPTSNAACVISGLHVLPPFDDVIAEYVVGNVRLEVKCLKS
jgi:hypothetical protein